MSQTPDKLNEELDRILEAAGIRFSVANDDDRFDKIKAETKAAITTAYAEAIRSAVPEREWADEIGDQGAIGFNAAIDTFTTNLKNQGLLPNGKDE